MTDVRFRDGQEPIVTHYTLSAEQEWESIRARQTALETGNFLSQATTTQDTGCAGSSAWLYSGTVANNGGTYKICFSGPSNGTPVDLGSYVQHFNPSPIPPTYWAGHTLSLWPGNEAGTLTDNGGLCTYSFNANASWNDVTPSSCVSSYRYLTLTN